MPTANFESLNRVAKADAPNHPNTRAIIVIVLKNAVKMVFNVFQNIFPGAAARYKVARDEAELEALLSFAEN